MKLSTPQLDLRLPEYGDQQWIYALNHDPLWLRFIGNRGVNSLLDAATYIDNAIKHFETHGYGLFAIEDRLTGKALGMCGLINRGLFSAPDLGFALVPEGRGKGLAFEACEAVIQFAREQLEVDYLTAMTHVDNTDSQKLLKRLGFVRQGELFMPGIRGQQFFWLDMKTPR